MKEKERERARESEREREREKEREREREREREIVSEVRHVHYSRPVGTSSVLSSLVL